MGLVFQCPNCGNDVTVRFLKVGDRTECPSCDRSVLVPPGARPVEVSETSPYCIHRSRHKVPPAADEDQSARRHSRYLASRRKRLLGYMIDQSLLAVPAIVIGLVYVGSIPMDDIQSRQEWLLRWAETSWSTPFVIIAIAVGALQAYLLLTRGQTVGKWALGTNIVTMDYRHPSWWRLVLVRPLIIVAVNFQPEFQLTGAEWGTALQFIFSGLFLVNAVMVYDLDRRALHDHLAGTQVVDLKLIGNRGSRQ